MLVGWLVISCWVWLQLGAEHERTIESSQCLKELTEKAVTVQKSVGLNAPNEELGVLTTHHP